MPLTFGPGDVYAQALALNESAVATGHFEQAYHFLMAAHHCAEDLKDGGKLAEIAALARRQQALVDALTPPHKLSSHLNAGRRGIFAMGANMAEAVIKRLDSERVIEEHRKKTG
jgi:hypothetical protein